MKRRSPRGRAFQPPSLPDCMDDPNLFGAWFRNTETWMAWRAFITALFGLPLDPQQQGIFRDCTGRTQSPSQPLSEAWLVCGRRAGKSFILALISVYLACFRNYRPYLAPSERATIMVIAADKRQSRVIMRYVTGLLTNVPMLAPLIQRETAEAFDLTNSVTIEIHAASFKRTRGYALAGALCDELAFWDQDDAAEPDFEVINALKPGMATIPGAMLLCASSPYSRKGALFDAYTKHYGKDGDPILVWQAATRTMNPTVPQAFIDAAYEADPANAAAEFGGLFRSDIEAFIAREAVEAVTAPGRYELPPMTAPRYAAFCDPSGGSSDSMTLAISHREGESGILDAVREWRPPFSPDSVVREASDLLKSYRLHKVTGDRYAGEWPRERFRTYGITYEPAELSKSDLYRELLPLLNSGRLELLEHKRLANQLCSLERRTARGGRDSIDHPPGQHDDVANAAAGALVLATRYRPLIISDAALLAARTRIPRPSPTGSYQ